MRANRSRGLPQGLHLNHQETNGAAVVRPIDFFYDPQKKNELENVPYYNGGTEGYGRILHRQPDHLSRD